MHLGRVGARQGPQGYCLYGTPPSALLNADFYTLSSKISGYLGSIFFPPEVSRINLCCNLKWLLPDCWEENSWPGTHHGAPKRSKSRSYVWTEFENKKLLVGLCDTNKLTTIEINWDLPLPPYVGECPYPTSDLATLLPPVLGDGWNLRLLHLAMVGGKSKVAGEVRNLQVIFWWICSGTKKNLELFDQPTFFAFLFGEASYDSYQTWTYLLNLPPVISVRKPRHLSPFVAVYQRCQAIHAFGQSTALLSNLPSPYFSRPKTALWGRPGWGKGIIVIVLQFQVFWKTIFGKWEKIWGYGTGKWQSVSFLRGKWKSWRPIGGNSDKLGGPWTIFLAVFLT